MTIPTTTNSNKKSEAQADITGGVSNNYADKNAGGRSDKLSGAAQTKPVSKKSSWFIAVVLVLSLVAWMVSGILDSKPDQLADKQRLAKAHSLPEVQVRRFALQEYQPAITLTGNTIAARLVVMKAERSALVGKLPVVKGEKVDKGQSMAVLDVGTTYARIIQSQALVSKEELYAESIANLIAMGLSSQLEQADAISRLETAKVQLKSAKEEHSKNFVTAPFAGLVTRQMIELGDYVGVGTPIFELADVSPVKVQAHITEKELAYIGDQTPKADVSMSTGENYEAVVSYIAPSTSGNSKTFVMELDLQTGQKSVPLGLTATATIKLAPVSAISISPSMLFLDNAGNLGLKYVDDDGIVRKLRVTIVQSVSDSTWITGDSLESRNIIVTGHGFVFPGDEVVAHQAIQGGTQE